MPLPQRHGILFAMHLRRRTALLAGLALVAPAARAQSVNPLAGRWQIEAIGTAIVPDTRRAEITFTTEGGAHGTSGCNRFMGGFTLAGAALRFGPVAGTRMACEPPAMEQEHRLHEALAATRGWRMDGATLSLTDASGTSLLTLKRATGG
jgi:putative lipoprotein